MRLPYPFLLGLLALPACARLERSAAIDPYASAPPTPSAPWRPPGYNPGPPLSAPALETPDPERQHDLPELVALGLRNNPETRRAWEEARAAAAQLGRAEGAYLPRLGTTAIGGTSRVVNPTPTGRERITGPGLTPGLELTWVLLDFGRRGAERDRAFQELTATGLTFDRRLQTVVFAVQRSFFALDAARASVLAAEATLSAARSVEAATSERLDLGLATRPELLLARQERFRTEYQLTEAQGSVERARADLADSVGIAPNVPLRVVGLAGESLPPTLVATTDQVMDDALAGRPDLAARVATLRAREAEVRQAQAAYWPTLGFAGGVGGTLRDYTAGPPFKSFGYAEPIYGTFLNFEWKLFEGFERDNALRQAESRRGAAEAELAVARLAALREVWRAYADARTSARKYEFATALLAASEESYGATLESYRAGLGDFLELLAAERELARARFTAIESKAEVLTASAALALAAGQGPAAVDGLRAVERSW